MQIKRTLIASAAVLALAGSVTGIAAASSKGAVAPKSASTESTSAPDTDNIQQGDQTSPDTTSASTRNSSTETSGETSGENTGETSSDGPGGHADPAGNVDHQFDGQE